MHVFYGPYQVLICNRKARMTHPKLIQASMGSLFTLPFAEFADGDACCDALEKAGFEIYLTDSRAQRAPTDRAKSASRSIRLRSSPSGGSRHSRQALSSRAFWMPWRYSSRG